MHDQTNANASGPESVRGALKEGAGWKPVLLIALLAACLFALRVASPANLHGQDQERPAVYVLDAVNNGNWLCQRDLTGDITSKPPLYTWCCALLTVLFGRINLLCLYLPGALGAFGAAWLVFKSGSTHFGRRAALFAVLAVLLTPASLKGIGLARTDAVFAFMVTAAALLAYRSWIRGGGWVWFWLVAAAATLTKGPLGVVLGAGGLLACLWERRSGEKLPLKGSHLIGIILFFLITGGWLLLAYWEYGQPVIAKLIGKELIGSVISTRKHSLLGTPFWQPPLYYLGRAAPWSLFAYYGLWRLVRRPAPEAGERRFERFLFCWFAAGLCIFSLSHHQRGDLLWPIMPAGALITGRELARLTHTWSQARVNRLVAAIIVVAMSWFGFYYLTGRLGERAVLETAALKKLSRALERAGGREFPLTHVDDPMALQFFLNTLRPGVSPERAAQLLRGVEPAFVAVTDWDQLQLARKPDDPPWFTLLSDAASSNDCPARIVANRPDLNIADHCAFCFGPVFVRVHGARLLRATEPELRFTASGRSGEIIIANESAAARKVRVCVIEDGRRLVQECVLAGNEIRSIPVGAAPPLTTH